MAMSCRVRRANRLHGRGEDGPRGEPYKWRSGGDPRGTIVLKNGCIYLFYNVNFLMFDALVTQWQSHRFLPGLMQVQVLPGA